MSRTITIAFAGSGKVKAETITALLDDFLGFGPKDADGFPEPSEHDINVILPASSEHFNEELQKVVDWTEYADLPYDVVLAKGDRDDALETLVGDADTVHEVPNVDKKVVDLLATAEGEKFLVLLWSDDDEHCEILLDLALTQDVPTKDLTAALDDLKFGDDEEETTPEPEPEPEKPVRGRRGSRRGAEQQQEVPEATPEPERPARGRRRAKEEPLEQEEEPLTEEDATPAEAEPATEPEKPTRGRRRSSTPEPEEKEVDPEPQEKEVVDNPAKVFAVDPSYLSGALQSIFLHLQAADSANAYRNLDDPAESPVTALAREALEHVSLALPPVSEEPEEEPVKRGRGRPRKPAEEETTGYLRNGDGVYRKAGRGRPKRGEEKVDLTPAEVDDLQVKGLILSED